MTIFILCEEVDIIGVYRTYTEAEETAKKYELHNWHIQEKQLK